MTRGEARASRGRSTAVVVGLALALALAVDAAAHVRLSDPNTNAPLVWAAPSSISVVISSDASPDLTDAERFTALRNAIDAWNDVPASALRLVEDTTPAQQDRDDFTALDLHQIRFDDGSSGFFPGLSGIVAVTPVKFVRGTIVDADILFNDQEFGFTTSGEATRIDVQDVATHELGHFVGLDHTGMGGATMYPFVSPNVVLQRSLAADDANGAADIAPAVALGRIHGRILRASDLSPVSGAHVSATDAVGRSVSAGLTQQDGSFELVFSEPGLYELLANPLGGVVGAENVAVEQPIQTNFGAFVIQGVNLAAGETFDVGDHFAPADVFVALGERADLMPVRVHALSGVFTGPHVLGGQGLVAGSTLSTSDPALALSGIQFMGSSVRFFLNAQNGAEPGHADLVVTAPSGAVDLIPGAIEIAPPVPTVSAVVPDVGLRDGGYVVTISGTGFRPGARVVLGENVYTAASGLDLLDASTIEILTRPSSSGERDVVAIDASGLEGRLVDGFRFTSIPVLESVFPPAGNESGGTLVILKGRDFEPEVAVRIAGVDQTFERVDGSTLHVMTGGDSAATALALEVENPGGHVASATFDYVVGPDPTLSALTPSSGLPGERVSVMGRGFSPDTTVVFGADPETGVGGVEANSVLFVGATLLEANVPSGVVGAVSVMVRKGSTGQATLADDAFTVQTTSSGGGGGCSTRFVPIRPADLLAAALGLAALLALQGAARRRSSPPSARVRASVRRSRA